MRKIGVNRSGSLGVWGWAVVSVLLVVLTTNPVCGQYRPVTSNGVSAQDVAMARASADSTWWTSTLILLALAGFALYYFREPVCSYLKTFTDGLGRDSAPTDPRKLAVSDPGIRAQPAQMTDGDRSVPATETSFPVKAESMPPRDS
jgi:hypothetical protein